MKQSLLTVLISVLLLYTSDIIAQDITCANLINEVYKDSEIIKPNSTNNPTVNYAKPNTQILDVRYVNDFVSGGGSNHYCNTVTDCTDGSASLIYQVYYPNTAYSETKKLPAVILFHAGGFSDCTNFNTTEMQTYCTEFAKRGFVAFNVEYRRGKEEDSVSKYTSASRFLAMYRCIQDARGAIRTIVSRELNNVTPYRIDVQSIFLGGLSSGSVMAIAAGYYNSTMINQIFPSVSSYLGDIDGDNYLGNASEGSYIIKGVLDLWGAAHLPLNFASNPAGFFSQNSKRPSLIAFHGGSDGVINIDSSNLFFSPSTSRYRSESLCVNGTYTLPDNGANKSDLKLYGSQGFYKILKTSLNIPCELYIDCDMKHGLDEATSDFGLANGDASAVSIKDVQVYIVQRAATFFQYVMNPNFPYTLTHTRFVDCLNSRYGCNSDSATACSDMAVTGTFYADADHDGYGNPVHSIQACPAPAGYVANNADCDDTDPNIHPGAIEVCDGKDNNCDGQIDEGVTSTFYADADYDGYGNPANSVQACSAPAGYVANKTDCDDTDPSIHPDATEVCDGKDNNCDGQIDEGILTTFYWDADGDGYGNPANSVQACSAPAGYVANNADCNDTDPNTHPGATEVCDGKDNNCDGQIDEGVTSTFYADADGDGYGNPVSSVQACSAPAGYVANNTDCDDTDPNIHPGATEICDGKDNNCNGQIDEGATSTFYADADGDGYGNPVSSVQACSAPTGYVANNADCDDADRNIHPGATEVCDGKDNNCNGQTDEGVLSTFYADADGDGYGNPASSVQACSAPAGYVANSTDCNDTDPNVHPGAIEICDGEDNNCDGQIDEGLGVLTIFYQDADGDGYGDPSHTTQACSPPTGYVIDKGDCDDTDPNIHPGATEVCDGKDNNCDGQIDEGVISTFYADADHDGYGNPANSVQACSAPAGYVANNTDCDDTDPNIHPGATEVCDGKDNNCDGQIDEGILTTFYRDADGDGYGNPASSVQACSAPAGYVANNTDCNDIDPNTHPGATEVCDGKDNNCDGQIDEGVTSTFYADADHDGYGNPNSSIKACTPPAGYVSNNGDCNDNDPAISPAAVEVCGNKIDDNCNGLADEQPCYVCQNVTNLSTTNITCNSAKLNWVSISNPLQWQVQYKINNKTAKWVDILPFPTGDIRSVTINSLLSNKGYVWHIRAKCSKTWTSYSNSISFKTATTCISSVNVSTINKNEISNATLKLYPNPTKGQFVVELHVTDKINAKAKIQLIDMTGKTVQTENAEVNSGSLQKTISISSNLTKGIYMVRILVNDKIYKTQLVYAK